MNVLLVEDNASLRRAMKLGLEATGQVRISGEEVAYLLGIVFGFGEMGVYFGIVAGNILGGFVGYLWARVFIGRLPRSGHTGDSVTG